MTALSPTPSAPVASAPFTVTSDGGFKDPNGNPFDMRGLNATPTDALAGFADVMHQYPGLTTIRLACDSTSDSAASIDQVVQQYTGTGVVVEIEDHYGGQDNVAWYQQMAQTYKDNPRVFLETPNEPDAANTAQNQIGIINAIKATGFNNPIGLQPIGGYDFSNIATVTAAVGTTQIFVTPHIYSSSTDPNAAAQYVADDIQTAKNLGLFPAIDEFGNAMDGVTLDPQGNSVDSSVEAANQAGQAGAVFWAMDNGDHANGADSAFLKPDGSQLTSTGIALQPWLTPTDPSTTPVATTPAPTSTGDSTSTSTATPTAATPADPTATPAATPASTSAGDSTSTPTSTPAATTPADPTATPATTPASTSAGDSTSTPATTTAADPTATPAATPATTTTATTDPTNSGSTFVLDGSNANSVLGANGPSFLNAPGGTGCSGSTDATAGHGEHGFGIGGMESGWSHHWAADACHFLKAIGQFAADHLSTAATDATAATTALTGTIAQTQMPTLILNTQNFSTNSIHW